LQSSDVELEPGAGYQARTSFSVTLSVWRALFLREANQRLFRSRGEWVWMLLEPVIHTGFILYAFTVIRLRNVVGADTVVWLLVGLMAFFLFRRTAQQATKAISTNKALFAYRQVKPFDAVLLSAAAEGSLTIIVALLLLFGAYLFGHDTFPADPMTVFLVAGAMWLLGLDFALFVSVANELVPEMAKVVSMVMTPLYLLSGVIFPLGHIPQPYQNWLMLNPLAHGLEAIRQAFSPYYHVLPETSVAYLYGFALTGLFLGLAMQRRFAGRLAAL
jgi:capsular polysaccharide transport system permease protein